jgi:hypothetical protein
MEPGVQQPYIWHKVGARNSSSPCLIVFAIRPASSAAE